MKKWVPAVIASGLLVIDRILKFVVLSGTQVTLEPFHFSLYRNTGLIFSLPSPPALSVILMIAALVLIIAALWQGRHEPRLHWPLALLIAGAISNLYDRLLHGFIIDYVYFADWWPIFNLADLMLMIAVIILIYPGRKKQQGNNN